MPTPIAHASSTAVVISSRYDMLPSRQLLRGGAECLVAAGIARHRADQMTVQLRGEAIQPIDQVLPLACEPGHHAPLLGPLKLGARKDLTDHAPQRVGRNLDECFGQCIPVPVPNCSLRT